MRCLAHRTLAKFALASVPKLCVYVVMEEAGGAERMQEWLLDFTDRKIARDADKKLPQIEIGVLAIHQSQTLYQGWRHDQYGVGISAVVPDQKSGPVFDGRWDEVKVHPKPRKGLCHAFHNTSGKMSERIVVV